MNYLDEAAKRVCCGPCVQGGPCGTPQEIARSYCCQSCSTGNPCVVGLLDAADKATDPMTAHNLRAMASNKANVETANTPMNTIGGGCGRW